MEFNVKLERYEGPYTKLLDLIQEHKLSITEVSLATIADEYIAYVRMLQEQEKTLHTSIDISQFVLVASTLMLIKARSLLPGLAYTQEEEKQVTQLEKKLELYKKLQEAGARIRSIYQKRTLYGRERAAPKGIKIFIPPEGTTPQTLLSIALLTISLFKPIERLKDIYIEQAMRLETMIENLVDRVQKTSFSLSSVAGDAKTFSEKKKTLIVAFIALLELIRSGAISATQEESGEILISKS